MLGTDRSGMQTWKAISEAFGDMRVDTGSAITMNLRFAGQYFDGESGLHQNYFRDYRPGTGRYVQRDPIGLAGGINTFSYVENNPLGMIDPSGLRGGGTIVIPTPMYRQPQLPYMPTRSPGAQPVYTPGTGSSSGGYTWRLEQTGNLADGVGALTGGGITGHHPSVPNAIETLIDPNRIEPFVPMGPIQGPGCRTICVPNRPNQCSANSGCTVHCGQFLESR